MGLQAGRRAMLHKPRRTTRLVHADQHGEARDFDGDCNKWYCREEQHVQFMQINIGKFFFMSLSG